MSNNKVVIAKMIKAICGVSGGALVLTETHPYLSLIFLAIGAAANEYLTYYNK